MSAPQIRLCPTDRLQIGEQTCRLLTATPAAPGFVNVEDPDDLRTFAPADLAKRLTQPGARLRVEEEEPRSKPDPIEKPDGHRQLHNHTGRHPGVPVNNSVRIAAHPSQSARTCHPS